MTIPPFPSQELAKLVLGYLAEEQLMTAYDEFLQASPYLDALKNEYDRIFMTSLRNILAEYRAVKIYVETCKPLLLRKKLVQCTNLLEVVKILVSYTDGNKLQSQDATDKIGILKHSTSIFKQQVCEVCTSLNLASCVCKSKQTKLSGNSVSHEASLETSVETTALEDLPGNHVTNRKKYTRPIEKDSSEIILNSSEISRQSTSTYSTSNIGPHCNSQSSQTKSSESSSLSLSNMVKTTDTPECREKIEEFNTILNKVCNIKSSADTRLFSIPESQTIGNSFQDFATGVNGNTVSGHENRNVPVPDSSTSENSIAQTFVKDCNIPREVPKDVNEHTGIQPSNTYPFPRIKPKSNEQKIKIISDIKVDSPFTALANATSTPLMQTILINGTPAYKQKLPVPNNNYTKDEIMAMPTIIVVPTTGPPQKLTQTKPTQSQKNKKVKTKTTSSNKLLGPLVIDVSSPVTAKQKDNEVSQVGLETGLVKTVDPIKNASVPKDNTIPGSMQTNTPQVLPPMRKSSSTPRRNSHIRVLDFTTPRRILHETINEKVPEETSSQSVEIVVSRSPNVVLPEPSNCINDIVDMSAVKVHRIETCHISSLNGNNQIEQKPHKKSNWDADLRTLAITNENVTKVVERKPKSKSNKKKKSDKTDKQLEMKEANDSIQPKKSKSKRISSPKVKKSKRKKLEEEEEQYNDSTKHDESKLPVVKPSFNIIYTQQDNPKTIDNQNKLTNEGTNETPEAERISLQNEIGAKLNISDFLETPYKQALYDIQMETPKFLGSVLPDEPISDIKIMSIPTPRFFDTPKPTMGTPYASRGTDYSSGGSYYKPDEQDYLRIPDLECPVTSSSSKEEPNIEVSSEKENECKKSSRPVRKCTKNVSYKAHTTKSKTIDDKIEANSTCSESTSVNGSLDDNITVVKTPKTPSNSKSKLNSKSETKKKLESGRKRKSPMKRDKPNTFMKIKPRRVTPTKEFNKNARRRSTVSHTSSPKTLARKRASGKEKTIQVTPIVVSAPTKSRRKSSTPRKLHCTKQFNSESSADSPEMNIVNAKINVTRDHSTVILQDSDTEQLALRWSDDGSQDATKPRESECEDINKIKEYIEASVLTKTDYNEPKGTLQVDLIKRGFDAETAKIIERDLLDTPTEVNLTHQTYIQIPETTNDIVAAKRADTLATGAKNVSVVQDPEPAAGDDDDDEDDLELSAYECDEESDNYICISEAKDTPKGDPVTLKDAWSMEVCIEDVSVRLRATNFNHLFEDVPENDEDLSYGFKETEAAVSSIPIIDSLYTPLKDRRSQCYEIFDSTLTSLDTPLKISSPKEKILEATEIEIVIEEELVENKDKVETKKRKRLQGSTSSEESLNESKKTKPDTQYLFSSANIQNIDIESVLKKLHGP